MTCPFARNVSNCCSYFNTSTYDLWHLTPAYIFKLLIDNADVYTFCKAHMLLELLSVRSGTSRFTPETIVNDLDTFIDLTAMTNYCFIVCLLTIRVFLFFKLLFSIFSLCSFLFYFFLLCVYCSQCTIL